MTTKTPSEMSFGDHLEALRPHLVRSVVALFGLFIAAFCLKELLVEGILFGPTRADFPTNRLLHWIGELLNQEALFVPQEVVLINTAMAGQLNLHLQISLWCAFVLAFPYLLWELWCFVRPALTVHEQRSCRHFVGWVSLGFFSGVAFGYLIMAPLTIHFLAGYTISAEIGNLIDIRSYLSTVIDLSLACAILFQLPLLIYFLTRMGLIGSAFLIRYRRHALVILALLAAVITPPDAFSMLLVLFPLLLLYEGSIRLSRRVERHRK